MMKSQICDLDQLIGVIKDAGEKVRNDFLLKQKVHIEKEGVDFATLTDLKTDDFFVRELKDLIPEAKFLTEERVQDDFENFDDSSWIWVIDPIDGTVNFSRGDENFAISVALCKNKKVYLACVLLPIKNSIFLTSDGSDSFLDDKKIAVSEVYVERELVIGCDWSWDMEKRKNMIKIIDKLQQRVRQIKIMGSAVADICKVASGQMDAYIHTGLKPWDVAASSLIARNAGAVITKINGEVWDYCSDDILVANPKVHQTLVDLLRK